jgi:hypothetical protein
MTATVWTAIAGLVGEPFVLELADGATLDVELSGAERHDVPGGGSMVLTFTAEAAVPEQGTYWISHDAIGREPVFLVPRSPHQLDATITWLDAP